jgi:hypothetical protein
LGIVRQLPWQKFERNAASAAQLFQNAVVADGLADHY